MDVDALFFEVRSTLKSWRIKAKTSKQVTYTLSTHLVCQTEAKSTIEASFQARKFDSLTVVWKHRYSRTKESFDLVL